MIILAFLGVLAAVWAWNNVHPLAGIVVGFLFVGGAGWKFLFGLLGFLRPSARQAYGPEGKQFIAAWEDQFGEMRRGFPESHPPQGIFQAWLKDYRRSGISAGDWLTTHVRGSRVSSNQSERSAVHTAKGRWDTDMWTSAQHGSGQITLDGSGLTCRDEAGDVDIHLSWDVIESYEIQGAADRLTIKGRRTLEGRPFVAVKGLVTGERDKWIGLLDDYGVPPNAP